MVVSDLIEAKAKMHKFKFKVCIILPLVD